MTPHTIADLSAHLLADPGEAPIHPGPPPGVISDATDPADPADAAELLPAPADRGWAELSAALTEEVPVIAGRDDLTVAIAPGAGHGAPACLLTATAQIEIDAAHLGVDPATARPDQPTDRYRYPVAWGLLVHECAHAAHTAWQPTPTSPAAAVRAALLLEESRIEAAQIRRRPDDRHWLRAAATDLILADLAPHPGAPTADAATPAPTPDPAPARPAAAVGAEPVLPLTARPATLSLAATAPAGAAVPHGRPAAPGVAADPDPTTVVETLSVDPAQRWRAGCAATLVLARADAGVLDPADVEPVADAVAAVLGAATVALLRAIWQDAHTLTDTDGEPMLELGRRWCDALGIDPTTPIPTPTAPDTAAAASAVVAAVRQAGARVRSRVAAQPRPPGPAHPAADPEHLEGAARARAAAAARVFTRRPRTAGRRSAARVGGPAWGVTATAATRAPRDAERAAARVLGRALDTAGLRDRIAVRTPSAVPPGRLQMRGALGADAQRAAGAVPTAQPFTRTTRRPVPTPPLQLGVACDVSGSMAPFAAPLASAAWILAHAARHTRVDTTTATVIFGRYVRALTHPGQVPDQVTEFLATDNDEQIDQAIDALDGALDLGRPDAARLLVIVSDGIFRDAPRRGAQTRIDRLRRTGCGVLWLAPGHGPTQPLHGVTRATLTDPAATARTIGAAATRALRAAY